MRLRHLEMPIRNRRSRVAFLRIVSQQSILALSTSFSCGYIIFLVLCWCESAINKYGGGFAGLFKIFPAQPKAGMKKPRRISQMLRCWTCSSVAQALQAASRQTQRGVRDLRAQPRFGSRAGKAGGSVFTEGGYLLLAWCPAPVAK